jgi:hypothetical protein
MKMEAILSSKRSANYDRGMREHIAQDTISCSPNRNICLTLTLTERLTVPPEMEEEEEFG